MAVRATGRNLETLAGLAAEGIETVAADLLNGADMERAVDGCSAVVHAGALSSAWGRRADFLETNAVATCRLFTLARGAGCRAFVLISSPSVYFAFKHRRAIREDSPLPRPVNAYAESKRLAEEAVLAGSSMRTVVLRPQAIFGEGETALLPRLLRTARRFGVPELTPGGPVLDLTYVDNVCHAVALALEGSARGTFNITNGEPVALLPFLKDLLSRLGEPWKSVRRPRGLLLAAAGLLEAFHRVFRPHEEPLLTRFAVGALAYDRTLDLERARSVLGYQPIVSLAEGVSRFVDHYRP
jgi:nucleoside-diphosphate-sugar epimerase